MFIYDYSNSKAELILKKMYTYLFFFILFEFIEILTFHKMEFNSRKTKWSKIKISMKICSLYYVFMFVRKLDESVDDLLYHITTLNYI